MPTIWDELRRLIDEAEHCLRAEEGRYVALKAQHRETQAELALLASGYQSLHQAGRNWVLGVDVYGPCGACGKCSQCELACLIEHAAKGEDGNGDD